MDTQAIIPILEKITVVALEECDCIEPIPHITLASGVYYAYPKADCSYRSRRVTPEEHNKLTPYRNSPLKERGESIAADLLQIWGEEKLAILSNFCYKYDIDDLHGGNVGYIAGKLVLTDYAGAPTSYYEDEENV